MQNKFFQKMTISLAKNKQAIEMSKNNSPELIDYLKNNTLTDKTYDKIAQMSLKNGHAKEFFQHFNNKEKKYKILFDLFLDNDTKVFNSLEIKELIDFLNTTDKEQYTNLHKIMYISDSSFSSKLLSHILPYKKDILFTQTKDNISILNTAFFKGVENISSFFDVIDKKHFKISSPGYSSPLRYTQNISADLFEEICIYYAKQKINMPGAFYAKNGKKQIQKTLLNSLIYQNDINKINTYFKYFPKHEFNAKIPEYIISFYQGQEHITQKLIEKIDINALTPKGKNDPDLLWLASRYYNTHKNTFYQIINEIEDFTAYTQLFSNTLEEKTEDEDDEFNFNIKNHTDKLDYNRRNYTALLAEYGDIDAIEALKNKGVFLIDDTQSIYSSCLKDNDNYIKKIDYFKQFVDIEKTTIEGLYNSNGFKYTQELKRPFLLSVLFSFPKNEALDVLIKLEDKYKLQFNDIDYALGLIYSVKKSDKKMFEYFLGKISIAKTIEICNNIYTHYSNDNSEDSRPIVHQFSTIGEVNLSFIKAFTPQCNELFGAIVKQKNMSHQLLFSLFKDKDLITHFIKEHGNYIQESFTFHFKKHSSLKSIVKYIDYFDKPEKERIIKSDEFYLLLKEDISQFLPLLKEKTNGSIVIKILREFSSFTFKEQEQIESNAQYLLEGNKKLQSYHIVQLLSLKTNKSLIKTAVESFAKNNPDKSALEETIYSGNKYHFSANIDLVLHFINQYPNPDENINKYIDYYTDYLKNDSNLGLQVYDRIIKKLLVFDTEHNVYSEKSIDSIFNLSSCLLNKPLEQKIKNQYSLVNEKVVTDKIHFKLVKLDIEDIIKQFYKYDENIAKTDIYNSITTSVENYFSHENTKYQLGTLINLTKDNVFLDDYILKNSNLTAHYLYLASCANLKDFLIDFLIDDTDKKSYSQEELFLKQFNNHIQKNPEYIVEVKDMMKKIDPKKYKGIEIIMDNYELKLKIETNNRKNKKFKI